MGRSVHSTMIPAYYTYPYTGMKKVGFTHAVPLGVWSPAGKALDLDSEF